MLVNDDERTLPLSELSTLADIVVDARLVRPRSRLSDDKTRIYTDYEMVPGRVVRSQIGDILNSPSPGMRAQLLLTVVGGEIRIGGKTVQATNRTMKPIKTGGRYLIFASKQGGNVFMAIGGPAGVFEVFDNGRVNPLLRTSRVHPDIDGVPLEDIVRIVEAMPGRR